MNDTPKSDTPETDRAWHDCIAWLNQREEREDPHHVALADLCEKLERERNEWRSRFSRAVEILEGRLHCADNCLCSGRRDVNNLRALLETTTKPTP